MVRRPIFFYLAAALGCLFLAAYAVSVAAAFRHGTEGKHYGFSVRMAPRELIVTEVERGAPEERLLKTGDRIVAIDGRRGIASFLMVRMLNMAPPDGSYTIAVVRGEAEREVRMPVPMAHGPVWWGLPANLIASLVCFAVAMLMGLLKPGERTAQFGCLLFMAFAALHLAVALTSMYFVVGDGTRALFGVLMAAGPGEAATGYLFADSFPKRLRNQSRWWTAVAALVLIASLVEWLKRMPWNVFNALPVALAIPYFSRFGRTLFMLDRWPHVIWKAEVVLILAAVVAVLVRNYHGLERPADRRRIRWVMCGVLAALAPELLLYLAYIVRLGAGRPMDGAWFANAEECCRLALATLSAVCVAYAVLRRKLLDVHVVVRRGVQYLFAKHVLQAAISLPLVLLVIRVAMNPRLTVRELLFGSYAYLALMVVGTVGLVYRRQLTRLVDRRFFREAYSQEEILRHLISEIQVRDSVTDISRLVSEKVAAALHPLRILVFYRHDTRGDFTLEHSSGGIEAELRVGAESPILHFLTDSSRPVDFPFGGSGVARNAEDEYFEKLGVRLIVPVPGAQRRLAGLLMLGEKRSEEPYTTTDRELLQAIAAQIGVVYDNIALREAARREMQIKRQVLAHVEGSDINLLKECPVCGTCFDRTVEKCSSDGAELSLTLPVERIVDGVYRLEQRIGAGGMSAVYRATDLRLSRPVALKIMTGSLFGNQAALQRFEREARAAARLSHPNIVAIHDYGSIGTEGAYLVMELVSGPTFRAELRRSGAMAPALAAMRFHQMLDGLAAAHDGGVVHRDLKPENVIVAQLPGGGELLKILDFGLAKIAAASDPGTMLTAAGAVLGTLGYMSPEQLLGEEVDARTDTFSVGVMVVEALTGQRPFAGANFQELLSTTLRDTYRLPGDGAAVERLDGLVQRCLATRRDDRPTVSQIRQELVEAIREYPGMAAAAAHIADLSTIDESAVED
jgi:hypothetical protein